LRQVSQNYRSGRIRIEQVNAPSLRDDGILVKTAFSVISAGTEGMKVREGKMSLLGKARARPDQVKKVLKSLRQQGPRATFEKVFSKLDSLTPLGYSLSGTVLAAGKNAPEFAAGQRVACAGAEYAHHAEAVYVPKNLAVAVPDNVSLDQAAFATIGAIAMQGFRRGGMQLGETACVVGLGLLGQILVRILRAAGINAVGVDLSRARCELAVAAGAALAGTPSDPGLTAAIRAMTGSFGADAVFITAGGDTTGPVEIAVEVARDRARVVDIGKTKIDLSWNDYYMKELDFVFSRSYGPGRYDPTYEERGVDYPIGYVRWTENRNMSSFLELMAQGRLDLASIITSVHPIADAETVYEGIARGEGGLGVLFQYPDEVALDRRLPSVGTERAAAAPKSAARVGVIGAGNYALSMLLPHLARDSRAKLVEVATRTPLSAANAQRRFPFERSSTDASGLLKAEDINAIVIATRHASHASLTAAALATGRPVFVEKPLAIDLPGLERVRQAVADHGNDRLQVGFNRRFAPFVKETARFFEGRGFPLVMAYRVHAGQLDATSWYKDAAEGSRFLGEGGHFLDVFAFLAGSRPVTVSAACQRPPQPSAEDQDNIAVTVTYGDGSIGQLLYLTQGGSRVPKEELEVFGGGKTARLHNFASLELFEGDGRRQRSGALDKGQRAEMAAFVEAVASGGPMPVPIDALFDTTLVTLGAEESLRRGTSVAIADYWAEA
jgi:predicted dehydrogenase/threonine dehydrogenase-like Zn-dependent dehydrogenase